MADTKTLVTADQFEKMSFPDERAELSEGEIIHMSPPGAKHCQIGSRIAFLLTDFVKKKGLGIVFGQEIGFRLSEKIVRAPDVSFVSRSRAAPIGMPDGFWPGAPDLAIEVASPGDSHSELVRKVQEYFHAGTPLVWILLPEVRQVYVYRGPKDVRVLAEGDQLTGDDLIPGFSIGVEQLFAAEEF